MSFFSLAEMAGNPWCRLLVGEGGGLGHFLSRWTGGVFGRLVIFLTSWAVTLSLGVIRCGVLVVHVLACS